MCGIVGIVSGKVVSGRLLEALKLLEYRGYDSAGIATLESGALMRRRASGKLVNLERCLQNSPLPGSIGIGHTRWATHGAPQERNAHPHATSRLALVHNGIIENFRELRTELEADDYLFESDTDTEAVAHLVTRELDRGETARTAFQRSIQRLRGSFAFAVLFTGEENLLIGARRGAPLVIGHGSGEMFLGSDAIALSALTEDITYLEDGDWAVLSRDGVEIFDNDGRPVERAVHRAEVNALCATKGDHRHFMHKETHEQPQVIGHTIGAYVDLVSGRAQVPGRQRLEFGTMRRMVISACGTGYYAGLLGRHYFERLAHLSCDVDVASEFRYREAPLDGADLALFVSQSGETADTLASLRYAKSRGLRTASVVNVLRSTIARESDVVLPTLAGPEIGVASTKAFTCQLTALAALAVGAGVERGIIDPDQELALTRDLSTAPRLVSEILALESQIESLASCLVGRSHAIYLGRGFAYPLALEGALKLKEVSYIHAEGYAAGELKHGPIALIDDAMPVIVIAPYDRVFEKTVSNAQEVLARGGQVILLTDRRGAECKAIDAQQTLVLPSVPEILIPIAYAIPLQLLAYHTALQTGTDVDQPRNLAKSVTVE